MPVRSNRREYGRLLAICDEGGRFFELERDLLEVYARYAASALDSAAALLEAERRNDSRALCWSWPGRWPRPARAPRSRGGCPTRSPWWSTATGSPCTCGTTRASELVRSAHSPLEATAGPVVSERSSWAPEPGGTLEAFLRDPNRAPQFIRP